MFYYNQNNRFLQYKPFILYDLSVYDIASWINSLIFSMKLLGYYSRQSSRSHQPKIIKCTIDQLAIDCTTNTQFTIRDGSLFTTGFESNIWHFHPSFLLRTGRFRLGHSGCNHAGVHTTLCLGYQLWSLSSIPTVIDNWYQRTVKI
jgi:hypothetical protein